MTDKKKKKLLKKTAQSYFVFGLIAMVISLIALFFIIQYFIEDETLDSLYSSVYRTESYLKQNSNATPVKPIIDFIEVEQLGSETIKDTLIYDPTQQEEEMYKELVVYKKIKNKNYKIVARTLIFEPKDIFLTILASYGAIIFSIFLAQYYISKKSTSVIWKPFFENLKRIKQFSLQSNQTIHLKESDILEFDELNEEIQTLTNKVVTDYQNLKQFTEDISHEIQTPLAIMQAKIGNFLDENEINKEQYDLLIEIQNNSRRLTILNKKLILLTKIENQQFKKNETINFTEILKLSIKSFEGMSQILIKSERLESIRVTMDTYLARIVADNLISNAIKYTHTNGEIFISTIKNQLVIGNTGENAIAEPDKLYNRFYREHSSKKALGLGLAIVKKICDTHQHTIRYSFKDKMHFFTIDFN